MTLAGIFYAIGKIIPGISGASLLMLLGVYKYFLNIIANPFLINGQILISFIPFILSFLISAIIILKLINYLLKNYFRPSYSAIIGFVISSILFIYPGNFNLLSIIITLISFLISYYFSFPDKSRFIYILKLSNIEYNEIIFLILKYIFNLYEINMSLKGFKLKNLSGIDKKCLVIIKNSLYKDEICNYLSNPDLVLEELKLKELKEKQFVKRP